MSLTYNIDEILQIAEQIERNGESFYRKAAENTADPKTRDVLIRLADYEIEHIRIFSKMRASLAESNATPEPFDPEGESERYLQAIANRRVFDVTEDRASKLTGQETPEEILLMALQAEKDAVVLYLGMVDMVTDPFNKNEVRKIMREEMSHITIITEDLDRLKG